MDPIMRELITHRDSHVISKPKIRIVHIFAPEIIKTDPSNFRELVQRLTGKPPKMKKKKKKKNIEAKPMAEAAEMATREWRSKCNDSNNCQEEKMKGEVEKEERGVMMDQAENYGGVFMSGSGDVDGFFHGLISDFPLLPLLSTSHMD